ncbi:transglutaminase-like cysteine peptidase [Arcobacter sp. LA11]|uniref:transglutaminase-like cysteine peptidase n=1 Tax=Arcobacter sp. LA11 TaxID=1898176 RepID=UPI0009337389|nr:transglutaminase-like cysteine peptidase [Arcobacter sp. LA11]
MKQLILLILISTISLSAKSITLSNDDLRIIKSSTKEKAITIRLIKYLELKKKIKDFRLLKKLSHVNAFYNKILPINDATKYKVDDHWATPKEFLINGKGDCEDYAIAKYFTLLETGIPKEKLFLSVVKVRGEASYHMILLYIENKKAMPLVLDNLSFKVVPFDIRKKLEPQFIFNEKAAYILKNKKIHKKVKINWGKVDKWSLLLNRVYKKNE